MKATIYWLDVDDDNGTEPELFATKEEQEAAVRNVLLGYWHRDEFPPDDLDLLYDMVNTMDDCVRWGSQEIEIELPSPAIGYAPGGVPYIYYPELEREQKHTVG